jgi:hypothetical protein
MVLRIVVPTIEAWLIADREALAKQLGIRTAILPQLPEQCANLKALLVHAALQSRKRDIRTDFTPILVSGRREGPGYAQQLIDFIEGSWSPERAAQHAPSLRRALRRIMEVVDNARV